MIRLGITLLMIVTSWAQSAKVNRPDMLEISERLRLAIEKEDWRTASALSRSLEDAVTAARDQSLSKASIAAINRILASLPPDTETAIVSQQAFTLIQTKESDNPGSEVDRARGYILGLLGSTNKGELAKSLLGRTLQFAVLAGRKFGLSTLDGDAGIPLGLIAYEGCSIYGFTETVSESVFPGSPETVISGKGVWKASGKQYMQAAAAKPREDTYWLTLSAPNILLICNHQPFLNSMLSAVASSPSRWESFAEWKHVDREAPIWGIRHLPKEPFGLDPRRESMLGVSDAGATGLTLKVDSSEIRLRWLTDSKENHLKSLFEQAQMDGVVVQQASPGLMGVSAKTGTQAAAMLQFVAMGLLGFVIIV